MEGQDEAESNVVPPAVPAVPATMPPAVPPVVPPALSAAVPAVVSRSKASLSSPPPITPATPAAPAVVDSGAFRLMPFFYSAPTVPPALPAALPVVPSSPQPPASPTRGTGNHIHAPSAISVAPMFLSPVKIDVKEGGRGGVMAVKYEMGVQYCVVWEDIT